MAMPSQEHHIQAFPTVFGRDILREVPNFVAGPCLVVTMADLWPRFSAQLPPDTAHYVVASMERQALERDLRVMPDYASIVGLGGGQAIDAAKYFAWRLNRPLHQFPTSLSVDAMYGHRAGVRENGIVSYVGWAVPETVYFDCAILEAAPKHINRAGIGDVLCFFTGVWDWEYASRQGKCETKWPYDPGLAAVSLARAEDALASRRDIRDLTPRGIRLIVEAFKWGGASFHGAGWCPRHIEGVEHYFFYALESRTARKFLHGQAVCLGILVGSMMHGRRVRELADAIRYIGVDIRPESMGITWDDVDRTIMELAGFVRDQKLPYGIANDFQPDRAFLSALRSHAAGGSEDRPGN